MDTPQLLETYRFLDTVSDFNEATEFDPANEPYIDVLIRLASEHNQAAISEEFKKPYLHPMVTVQQHVDALKELVRHELNSRQIIPR